MKASSFLYALKGISYSLTEINMRVHVIATLLVIILGLLLSITKMEWIVVLFCIGFVMTTEILNTALEEITDLVNPNGTNHHPTIGKIKDLSAGAVLVSSLISAVIGLLVFVPYIFN